MCNCNKKKSTTAVTSVQAEKMARGETRTPLTEAAKRRQQAAGLKSKDTSSTE